MSATKHDYSMNFLEHHLPTEDGRRLYAQEAVMLAAASALIEAMEKSGKNRTWLADAIGKTPGFVSQVLSGSRNMTLKTLADFAFALGLEVEEVRLAPVGESLVPKDAMDRWLDEESVIAKGSGAVMGTTEYRSVSTVASTVQEIALVG